MILAYRVQEDYLPGLPLKAYAISRVYDVYMLENGNPHVTRKKHEKTNPGPTSLPSALCVLNHLGPGSQAQVGSGIGTDLLLDVVGQSWSIILENEGSHPKKWIPLAGFLFWLHKEAAKPFASWVQLGYMIVTASQRCFFWLFS